MDSMNWRENAVGPLGVGNVEGVGGMIGPGHELWTDELSQIPDAVRQFLVYFCAKVREANVAEIHNLYEDTFNKLSNRYYKSDEWPLAEVIAPLVESDEIFLMLYKELYFRHIHASSQPSLEQRLEAWENYCLLFNQFLNNRMLEFDLPQSWLWDIVDEFIYQFEDWSLYRSKLKNKSPEEIEFLQDSDHIWNVNSVLQYLHALVNQSNVCPWLLNGNEPVGSPNPTDNDFDLSSLALYRYIGYFSIIGLLRIHCLLQDYRLALMVLQPLDFDATNPLFTHVSACHVSLFYFMGFAFLMLRRYEDAVRVFSTTLMHIGRIKQYHTRSYQYDQINKRSEKMLALLALCFSFSPQSSEQASMGLLREKYSDKLARLRAGEESLFEELFVFASPKFISPAPPNYEVTADSGMDCAKLQLHLFMNEVRQQLVLPQIRSYLKLYRAISLSKLASFMETDETTFRSHLLSLKHKGWTIVGDRSDPPLLGSFRACTGVDFYIDNNVVHIADSDEGVNYGEFFLENIERLEDLMESIRIQNSTTRVK
uniref:Eukaryotic translation initiation factor 3 subunit L n=1 Tax=Timspurckia oligopyrenoides TaxID=708627 RepID=A0A7S0ZKV5_9RHOD|mmetsp:Transcript_9067/g.16326  ORF Transcript_9067/g.16326 Transcript_9067/m.16326 type:complete len:539 (+) Transcript_9067:49-1665(+)